MSIMISTPLVIGPGSVTAEMMDSGVATVGQVLTADGAGGADFAAPAGGSPGYLEYVALLTQTGTNAPVATVLKNTLGGAVVWTRDALDNYRGTLTGAFPAEKVWIQPRYTTDIVTPTRKWEIKRDNNNSVVVIVTDGFYADGFAETHIEIRVYP